MDGSPALAANGRTPGVPPSQTAVSVASG